MSLICVYSLMLIALRGVDARITKLPLMLLKLVKLQEQCHGLSFQLSVSFTSLSVKLALETNIKSLLSQISSTILYAAAEHYPR